MTSPEERAKAAMAEWDKAAMAAMTTCDPDVKVPTMEECFATAICDAEESEREECLNELAAHRETYKAEEERLKYNDPIKAGCHKVAAEALQDALLAIKARGEK